MDYRNDDSAVGQEPTIDVDYTGMEQGSSLDRAVSALEESSVPQPKDPKFWEHNFLLLFPIAILIVLTVFAALIAGSP